MYLIATSFWLQPESWIAIFQVVIGLGLVIFVHELGHFLVAKACGVKCEKFYVGFDVPIKIGPITLPAALWKKQWGETEYGIGIIPLGGYVKMLGQDDNPGNQAEEAERSKIKKESPASAEVAEQPTACEEEFELDPRSYMAKSVPKRMAIISAGVIMNVIFAVIFAAIAYRLGVRITPTVIGSTATGSPAWVAALRPGDRIVQIGRHGPRSEHLRFYADLAQNVVINGTDDDMELLFQERGKNGSQRWVSLRPEIVDAGGVALPSLGIRPPASATLAGPNPAIEGCPAAAAKKPFMKGDRIVAIVVDGMRHEIKDYFDLRAVLAQFPEEELDIVVRRGDGNKSSNQAGDVSITVGKNPLTRLGIVLTAGPIVAIAKDSPAEAAGLKVGDVIKSANGATLDDPITMPDFFRRLAGQEVEIEVERKTAGGGTESLALTVTPRQPITYGIHRMPGAPMAVEALGIAYPIENTVLRVEPESPAAKAGLKAKDVLLSARFIAASPKKQTSEKNRGLTDEDIPLDDEQNWLIAHNRMQWSLEDTKIRLKYRRDKKISTLEDITPEPSDEWFSPNRGFTLELASETHTATTWGEAWSLGLRNTKESLSHVFMFLNKLVTGKISPTNLGGPGTIAVVATSEAGQGISRLLLFLTLLSANLAIINFLPIPVLDGGHMVFLAYEGIRGRPVDEKWAFRLTMGGLTFILCLMVFVVSLDVWRFAQWFS